MTEFEDLEKQIAGYDAVLARDRESVEPEARSRVADALVWKGVALLDLDRQDDAIECFDRVVARFGEATELDLREHVARALRHKGLALKALGREDDAKAAYDEVVARVGDAAEPELRTQLVLTLYNTAYLLRRMGRNEDAVVVLADLLNPFTEEDPPPGTLKVIAKGMLLAANAAGELGQPHGAVALYDEILKRFGQETALGLRVTVALALTSRAHAEPLWPA